MNKWLEYHEAMERRIMEMMRPEAPDPAYERGPQTALDCGKIACVYKDKGDYAAAMEWRLRSYRLMLEYGEDPEDLELETKQMYDLYQKMYPRKWFQRPKPRPFNDWLYEQLSGQPD